MFDFLKTTKNTLIPSPVCNNITFWPIPDNPQFFCRKVLPHVPKRFINEVENLFYFGGKLTGLAPNVDAKLAYACMIKMLSSFEPSHESKMATAGYALWVWSTPEAMEN